MVKRRRKFGWVRWLVLVVILVAIIVGVVILIKNNTSNRTDDNGQRTVDINDSETKKEEKTEEKTEETPEREEKVPQYEGDSPNKSETLTGLMSYADVINDELVIRISIDQFLQSGNCNLVISRNGVTYYTQSVGIIESVTTSTCDGFKVPVGELPKGDLQVGINLESDGKSGRIEGRVRI